MENLNLSDYNLASQKFFNMWLKKKTILGVKSNKSRRTDESFIFYIESNKIRVAILTKNYSKNDGSCFFGDIEHFKKCIYCHVYGWKNVYRYNLQDRDKKNRINAAVNRFLNIN